MTGTAYKSVLITAAVYSVVIGAIYVALSVGAILTRACWWSMEGSSFFYMVYVLYFRNDECHVTVDWSRFGLEFNNIQVVLPPESEAVSRTSIFAFVYLGLYGALIFTALYSLCGINNSCLGRKSFPIFFAPWMIVCVSILVMDVIATAFYIMDTINLTDHLGLMEVLKVGNQDQVGSIFENLGFTYRMLPPIFMFLVTSKIFIFMVMDIVIIVLVTKAGWAAATYHKQLEDTVRHYSSNMSRANPAFEDAQVDQIAQKQHNKQLEYMSSQANDVRPETPDRYNDTAVQAQAFVYPSHISASNRQEQVRDQPTQRPSSLAVSSRYNNDWAQSQQAQRDIDSRLSHYTASNGSVIRSTEPLKDEKPQPQQHQQQQQQQPVRVKVLPSVVEVRKSNENRHSANENRTSDGRLKPVPPPKPFNPNRNSMQPWNAENDPNRNSGGAKVDRTSSMNEELRSQLPWSYFKARDDVPKKSFTELKEDEDLPSVPVPDYTLHFPRGKRANLGSDSDGEGSLGRYEQRY